MRFLLLNHNIYSQGTFLRCFNMAKQLAALGHDIVLVTVSPKSKYRSHQVKERRLEIICTPSTLGGHYQGGGWGVYDIVSRIALLIQKKFDLVYAFDHRPNVALPAYMQKHLKRTPMVTDWADWWCRGGLLHAGNCFPLQYAIELFLEEHTKRASDAVTTISTALWERARSLGIPESRLLYLPSGADVENIKPLQQRRMREIHAIPQKVKVVGFISANLLDAELLMLSMAQVFEQRNDCRLLFIGPDKGPHRDLAIRLNIDDLVIWTGFQPYESLAEFLGCADIMALPMTDHPVNKGRWPNKIGEHMAAGKATVASAVGEMKKLFTKERIGLLAQPNEADFADKVVYLLDEPQLAQEMGAAARSIAETKYSWRALTVQLLTFLRKIIPAQL